MSKTYIYKDLTFDVPEHTEVYLTVEYISDGTTSHTVINKPGPNDPEIVDEGSVRIGLSDHLRSAKTYIVTVAKNFFNQEDTIAIRYKINQEEILVHSNPKSETSDPIIILHLTFPLR